jgi:hypothetical protein
MDALETNETLFSKRGRKISTHVTFFKTGVCLGKNLVCVVKSSVFSSTIKALEPVATHSTKKKGAFHMLLGGSKSEAMKVYKEFFIPTESNSIHFLRTKLCVGCTKGFEIVDLETLNTQGLLDPSDESLNFALKRENVRPMSIFRIRNGDFLLCYDEFAFYVNKSGRRSRPNWLIQWEGEPTSFALHYPYILAFDAAFVEIRNVESGELVQVIPSNDLRSLNTTPDAIHCAASGSGDYQHVFKLVLMRPEGEPASPITTSTRHMPRESFSSFASSSTAMGTGLMD